MTAVGARAAEAPPARADRGLTVRTALAGRAARRTVRGTLLLAVPLAALAAAADLAFSPADLRVVINFLITIVLVLGIQTFSGNSGIISFGHVAFMGVGAYVAALVATPRDMKELSVPHLPGWLMELQIGFLPTLAVAGAVTALVALVVGGGLVRMRENAMAMATFAILVIFSVIFASWNRMTGGAAGIYGIPGRVDVWAALGFVVAALAVARLYRESRVGLKLRASREDELAAAALGAPVRRLRLGAWVLSAAFMGIGGGVWAQYNLAFGPQQFDFGQTFDLLAMLVVGGLANVSGAVVGAVTIMIATEILRRVEDSLHIEGLTEIVVALTIVVALRARPLGLVGLHELDDLIARSRALRRAHALRVRLARMLRRRRGGGTARLPVDFSSRVVPVAGGTLEVWEAGAGGIPCVYFHPYLLGGPPAPGGTLADTLAGASRTIVVAPRGLGGSSAPASAARLGLSQIVDDMESVRTALGIDEWVPVGWSLGGAAALEYALRHPAATARLVLVCSPSSWRFYEDPASIYNPLHPDSWREEEARRALDGSERTSRAWLELTLGDAMRNEAAVEDFLEGAQLSAPALYALRDDLLADPPWDAEDRLGEISCPVLVVAGRHDTQVPPVAAERLAALLPRAELALFDASGHHPAEEEPARFREVVTDFLSRAGMPAVDPQASGV